MSEVVPELDEVFPFEYVGGGYFRRKGVPRGVSADILHGMQAVEFVRDAVAEAMDDEDVLYVYRLCRHCLGTIVADDLDCKDWVHEAGGLSVCDLDEDSGFAEPVPEGVLGVWSERGGCERSEDLPALPEADMDGARARDA